MIERYAFRIKNDFCQHWPYVHQTWQHPFEVRNAKIQKKSKRATSTRLLCLRGDVSARQMRLRWLFPLLH